jgi:hypothetical protein
VVISKSRVTRRSTGLDYSSNRSARAPLQFLSPQIPSPDVGKATVFKGDAQRTDFLERVAIPNHPAMSLSYVSVSTGAKIEQAELLNI